MAFPPSDGSGSGSQAGQPSGASGGAPGGQPALRQTAWAPVSAPVGVPKVLVADLQEDHYITVHTSTPVNVQTGHGSNHSGLSLCVLDSVPNGISTL